MEYLSRGNKMRIIKTITRIIAASIKTIVLLFVRLVRKAPKLIFWTTLLSFFGISIFTNNFVYRYSKEKITSLITSQTSSNQEEKKSKAIKVTKAKIERVVDGDTIDVYFNGKRQRIRLIGCNTPESVASKEYLDKTGKKNTSAGKKASKFTKKLCKTGTLVYLEKDKENTDKYGRVLRYVWLKKPPKYDRDKSIIKEKMLNAILIDKGYAELMTIKPNIKYAKTFEKLVK